MSRAELQRARLANSILLSTQFSRSIESISTEMKGNKMRIYATITLATILTANTIGVVSAQAAIDPICSSPGSASIAKSCAKRKAKANAKAKALKRARERAYQRRMQSLKKARGAYRDPYANARKARGPRRFYGPSPHKRRAAPRLRRNGFRHMRRFNAGRRNFGPGRSFRMNRFRGAPRFRMRGFGRRR